MQSGIVHKWRRRKSAMMLYWIWFLRQVGPEADPIIKLTA